jgi:hypothetical protein
MKAKFAIFKYSYRPIGGKQAVEIKEEPLGSVATETVNREVLFKPSRQ